MRCCAFNRGIVHAMHFLAATTTQAVSANVAVDTTLATRRTLAVTLVTRSDAATVQPCLAAVDSFRGEVLRAIAVQAITVVSRCFLECGNLNGIARSSACDLRISRTWFLKTFRTVSRALFNNTCCFNALSWSCCRTVLMFMLAVRISLKCFSHLKTSRSESANHA